MTQPSDSPISILLAEDHAVVREGLRMLLAGEGDLKVVGHADNGRQAVELAMELRPDVVVMDVAMPLLNGLEATRQINRAVPSAKVLVLSAHAENAYVELAAAHGAAGYVLKQDSSDALLKAIHAVHAGGPFFAPSGMGAGRGSVADGARKAPELTGRETEVVQLVAEGMGNKGIAVELGISVKTVEKHRQSLMQKLDIHDTAGLTRYAISAGIIQAGSPEI
ncbi:MAG TPA: response regulator transcription factor [Fibrobacteria bacterium]|jgi:DNA-binding NarL/FixJ family response regulator|nr:response regulator transcription factor [Fibrobacteria bacterium]